MLSGSWLNDDVIFNILLLPHICTRLFTPYQFCELGHLIYVCQFLSLCVNSLLIKALCIEDNSDSHYNFVDKELTHRDRNWHT